MYSFTNTYCGFDIKIRAIDGKTTPFKIQQKTVNNDGDDVFTVLDETPRTITNYEQRSLDFVTQNAEIEDDDLVFRIYAKEDIYRNSEQGFAIYSDLDSKTELSAAEVTLICKFIDGLTDKGGKISIPNEHWPTTMTGSIPKDTPLGGLYAFKPKEENGKYRFRLRVKAITMVMDAILHAGDILDEIVSELLPNIDSVLSNTFTYTGEGNKFISNNERLVDDYYAKLDESVIRKDQWFAVMATLRGEKTVSDVFRREKLLTQEIQSKT